MKVKKLFLWTLSFIVALFLIYNVMVLFTVIQEKMFLPQDYIFWTFSYPISRLSFIFFYYFIFAFFAKKVEIMKYAKRNGKWFYPTFVFANSILIYTLLFNVCVITNNTIINHTFLSPQGKVCNYSDIVRIDTGVSEKRSFNPLVHTKGDFYYLITLKDGTAIDLNDVGGTKNNKDVYEVLEATDRTLVNKGINKTSKIETLQYFNRNLIFADRIENILNNVK
ncbi:hypothetical protein [Desulfosporosinus nitroreducens]|uniref:Uncharacterized protein n=1 Tax=Desulfosporosinus nitroreducens TaxID=2018668 RepID=A0ABT8QY19_9FIRM|nr:hypothetical protein [Desulfosporosinus nitroreducens]MDO0825394.1 hypothetical protein [Desulfosporosinus nitroreducens]